MRLDEILERLDVLLELVEFDDQRWRRDLLHRHADFGRHVELQLTAEADSQLLLQHAVGRIRIHRFERVNPTLHHIFVREVGGERNDA